MSGMLFDLALALLVAHELDAVHRHEWRMFPLLRRLDDRLGYAVFLLLHVPLVAVILWLATAPPPGWGGPFRIAFGAFCVLHVGLHRLYASHPANEFGGALSRSLIWATGLAGAALVAVEMA